MSIYHIGQYSNDANLSTPESLLDETQYRISEGGDLEGYRHMIIITVDDIHNLNKAAWSVAGLSAVEVIGILEFIKKSAIDNL